jgi:hypothetical protein
MRRIAFLIIALAASTAAFAQVYKCRSGGTVAYLDRPCTDGVSIEVSVPSRPQADIAQAKAAALREREALLQVERVKLANELRSQREAERQHKAVQAKRQKCERLRLRYQWAEEDLARKTGPGQDAARVKLRRQAEELAVECPA